MNIDKYIYIGVIVLVSLTCIIYFHERKRNPNVSTTPPLVSPPLHAPANLPPAYISKTPATAPQSAVPGALVTGERISDSKQLWALATTALLTQLNGQHHDILGGDVNAQAQTAHDQQILRDGWKITDRQSLQDTLDWLANTGEREEFARLGKQVQAMEHQQQRVFLQSLQSDRPKQVAAMIAQQYYPQLGQRSLLGWDLARLISVCRLGYGAGYLTDYDAWQRIMPVARQLQHTFSSWQDLSNNVIIGHMYWQAAQTTMAGDALTRIAQMLLSNPASPWVKLPWGMDLGNLS